MNRDQALLLILKEYDEASEAHRPFNSAHEGYAVILEEVEELWGEIRRARDFRHQTPNMAREAVQIGAMALRFLVDLCEVK